MSAVEEIMSGGTSLDSGRYYANEKPGVDGNFWRGIEFGVALAIVLWAAIIAVIYYGWTL